MQDLRKRLASPLSSTLTFCLSAMLVLLLAAATVAQTPDDHPELPRFHQLNEELYRGAQPRAGGLRRLAELGVVTVLNLRGSNARTRMDEAEAKSLGLKYFNVPLPVWGRPSDSSIRRVMEIIAAAENRPVFVHCKDGVDRTGMIVALYRMSHDGWLPDVATAEAMHNGMRSYQYWMRDYIHDFYVRGVPFDAHHGMSQANHGNGNGFKDKIGIGVRVGERAVLKLGKTAVRIAWKSPRAVNGFFAKAF
jgi:tyrosine-protein phosphatase SIW14